MIFLIVFLKKIIYVDRGIFWTFFLAVGGATGVSGGLLRYPYPPPSYQISPNQVQVFQEQKYITQAVRNVLKLSRQIYVTESEKYCMRRPPMLTLSSVISDITQFFLISGEMFLLLNHFVPLILCHIRYHPTKFNFSLSKNRNI